MHSQKAWAPRKPEQCKQLVSKFILLVVAESQERFKTLAVIIAGATDRQNVAKGAECAEYAEAVSSNRNFIAAVSAAGYPEVAVARCLPMGTLLQPYGEQVWLPDVSGFTRGTCSSARCLLCICCVEVYYMC